MWHSFLGDRSKHSGTKRPHRTGFGKVSLEADYRVKNIHDMQSCCILFVYVSMISSQEWAPQTMHKNNRKVHHSAEKSPCHTSYSAHVLELLVFKPRFSKTAFSASSWGQVSTFCSDLPRKQWKNDDCKLQIFMI